MATQSGFDPEKSFPFAGPMAPYRKHQMLHRPSRLQDPREDFATKGPATRRPEWLEFVKDYDVVDALTRSPVGARLRSKLPKLTAART